MSRTHTVITNDLLWKISQKYYGIPEKWHDIVKANPQLQGRNKAVDGSPLIYIGDKLIIPDETEKAINPTAQNKAPESIKNVSDDAISILIDGNLFSYFTTSSMTFNIDTFDTFSFSAPFDDTLKIYRDTFRPFSYNPVSIYYGQELIFTGTLIAPQPQSDPSKKEFSISGYAKPAILNDCHMPFSSFPLEFNNQNLSQITATLCKPYGVSYSFIAPPGNPFEQVSIEMDKEIFPFLADLAKNRGLLITNDKPGKLIYWKSNTGTPVASFKIGQPPFISCSPQFNYQSFYSHITGTTAKTETSEPAKYTYENKYLINKGIIRNYNYKEDKIGSQDIKSAVLSKVGRMFGESVSYSAKVYGHKDKNGKLYEKNTIITLLDPSSMIYRESNFLIKSLTMSRSDSGDTTDFSLVLPGVYNDRIPEKFPWED